MSIDRTKPFRAGIICGKAQHNQQDPTVTVLPETLAGVAAHYAESFGLLPAELAIFLIAFGYGYREAAAQQAQAHTSLRLTFKP
jgi:hypothetical protein